MLDKLQAEPNRHRGSDRIERARKDAELDMRLVGPEVCEIEPVEPVELAQFAPQGAGLYRAMKQSSRTWQRAAVVVVAARWRLAGEDDVLSSGGPRCKATA